MIKYLLTLYDDHIYFVTDELTGLSVGVRSLLAPSLLESDPELFDDVVALGIEQCREKWKTLNTPSLVLTMQNTTKDRGVINEHGELCID